MVVDNLEKLSCFEGKIKYCYDKIWFHKLNAHKAERIVAFWFGAPKEKACLIGGVLDKRLLFPYSSPFSMIETIKVCGNEDFEAFVGEIDLYSKENNVDEIHIKLPPMIYDESNITKCMGAFLRAGYFVSELELNFHMNIVAEESYRKRLQRNGKKNLNHALTQELNLELCVTTEEKYEVYKIIKENRASKGYYLSMTWEDVENTIKNVEHDFFVLTLGGKNIASAIVFCVTEDIWQVIYWGDLPGYEGVRPMNYLSYSLNKFYYEKGIRVLDIGPSMWEGKPNYGLCNFKESIGCSTSSKFVLRKEFV